MPYRRTCPQGHDRVVWLCRPHAWVLCSVPCHCAECLERGGHVEATLEPCLEVAR